MERAAASATYLYCQQIRSISDKYFELKNKICFIDATIQKAYNVFLYLLVILRREDSRSGLVRRHDVTKNDMFITNHYRNIPLIEIL